MLSEVHYVSELRKNMISLGTLKENGYSFFSDGDRDIMRIIKSKMTVITTRRTAGNIYKLLGGTIMGDVAYLKLIMM